MYRPLTRQSFRPYLLVSLLGVSSWGCGGKSDEQKEVYHNEAVPDERLPSALDSFEELRCGKRAVEGVVTQCGVVEVPLSPGSSETTELSLVRVFTDAVEPKADPVIYLDGGPGVETLSSIEYMVEALRPLYPDRDMIFFDQRGVGRSRPPIDCNNTEGETVEEVLDNCFAYWSERVDLDSFRTKNSAYHVAQLVGALGYDQVNVLGISYGTRLALTVMREHPEIVRSSVIDSVVALQEDLFAETALSGYQALNAVFEACAADYACRQKYTDPKAQLQGLIERLDATPIKAGQFEIDGHQMVNVIFQMMYSSELLGYIPYFIDQIDRGVTEQLQQAFASTSDESGFSFGMHLSLQCAEELAFSSKSAFEALDGQVESPFREALSAEIYLDYCSHWPVTPAPAVENEPVVSELPTLVLAGRFDPITPPRFAEAAFNYLSEAHFYVLDSESHGASISPCGESLVRSFTDDPRGTPSAECVLGASGLDFQSRTLRGSAYSIPGRVRWQIGAPTPAQFEDALSRARTRRKVIRR